MAQNAEILEEKLKRALSSGAPVHASAVALEGNGLLILGASGSGKSGLALQLLALGAGLVADDGVLLESGEAGEAGITLRCPPPISGLIEARGLGLVPVPAVTEARLCLIVDLDAPSPARLPAPQAIPLLGHSVPLLPKVDAAHFPAALMLALRAGGVLTEERSQ
ncbi:HPr kinase/phosphorylase [Pseudoruegeria sp. SHC-113]|uniref:HPr kinase/phosphorylase n=1 Tax=Pseudoruegeria sp. SHC-113 TaxID=2855439 RepID=UPI0021BB9C41|nr:serine kinase [Pseudoruegeria sp. SHC-113]MCT8159283.1 serine kinase [Pseudoruegeria sp. SHC-113]